ncbi:MAG: elongation factor EF-2 [Candidatus Altiarchaeales archaeon]|nr:MAG: elongation factor EF-2 [Candidatus Altiarchaeales archaeon]RLI95092.1 MAG: elongation factor EF-2 [Candidatus Altiarchaeales archaeon]RLI95490.1 MAG: elongation factor EF-2 [Candidatus Altiarchaeales archaeon]HDO81936.1 elongation factor EF-2 [Candidatus Altiarchaeales archaeon]HEX54585.1 elongation factor EF-2 [Candidatus Altiarchaeales archaeon]
MGREEQMAKKIKKLIYKPERIRNMGIVAHIDHGKTTLSDNLLYHAGMISKEMAGKQLALDFHEDERARGITINAANVSMVHEYKGEEYLINLIDTPGHVDFGGDVTRAMRAVDGVIVVVCAVEGVMPQTKTVISQALRERVKPVLFINKVDRLINELRLSPEELQKRFFKIIMDVNKLIKQRQPDGVDWRVNVETGSVAFGSAYHNWAISVPYMKETGITFKDIIDHCLNEKQKELADKAPVYEIVLDMVIRHLPNPADAQKFRIPQIWKGDLESDIGKAMLNCDPDGRLAMMITNISVFDKREGEVATARIFSGTIRSGDEVYLVGSRSKERVQQVSFYMGASRVNTDEIPAGNILGITGLKRAFAGETISDDEIEMFEPMIHTSEPVVTIAVETKNMRDLPRVIEVLRQVAKEDPTLSVKIDEETGEHLLSGMGELHLEIITNRIRAGGLDIETSSPIVVYRETVSGSYGPVEGKSPNKHNKFYISVEPLEEKVYRAIISGEISEGRRKDRSKDIRAKLVELGMDREEAKRVIDVYRGNIMVDMTKGIQHLDEVMELMLDAFEMAMDSGPLAKEPVTRVKVKLVDAVLHEDAIHRGPAQVYPAVKRPIYACMLKANPILLEPIQKIWIDVPQDYMSSVTRELQRRRGTITNIGQKDELVTIEGMLPVAESFGFAGDIRSVSEGHALWSTENAGFEKLPSELLDSVIRKIRERKGLPLEIPKAEEFME